MVAERHGPPNVVPGARPAGRPKRVDVRTAKSALAEIGEMMRGVCGIHLPCSKEYLIHARLQKRLRALEIPDLSAYVRHVKRDTSGVEFQRMIDCLATNLTHFFREPRHFEYLVRNVVPEARVRPGRPMIRVWSAACSSGEEAYSVAISLLEALPDASDWDIRILATDISSRMIEIARRGMYPEEHLRHVTPALRERYFARAKTGRGTDAGLRHVAPILRRLVHFTRLNLMDPWPMRNGFDAVFCRNVMIYFDKPTQQHLVERLAERIIPGGALFLGHAESLAGVNHAFRFQEPTVYVR